MSQQLNKVHLIDCMDFMRQVPNGYFDLAICDPPYGLGWDKERESMSAGIRKDGSKRNDKTWKHRKLKNYKNGNYDFAPPDKKYFDELFRISKYQIIWGGNFFTDKIPISSGWIVWDKKVSVPSLSKCELAWTNYIKHIEIFRYLWAGYRKEKPENRIHVNQKPVALYKWLLQNYAKPDWKIFDSHVGSRSLGIACYDMGFYFEGCELDPDYWKDQEERFKNHIANQELFSKTEMQQAIYENKLLL